MSWSYSDPCPLDYKYYSDKEYKSTIGSDDYMRKTSYDPENFKCLDSSATCENNEFYYEEESKTICIDKCPSN